MFTQDPEGIPPLRVALERARIIPLLPHQMTPDAGQVAVIVIERPAGNAATILANVRKHPEFSKMPVLVILEQADRAQAAQLTPYKVDIFFKPVNTAALQRYLENLNGAALPKREEVKHPATGAASRTEEPESKLKQAEEDLASILSSPVARPAPPAAKQEGAAKPTAEPSTAEKPAATGGPAESKRDAKFGATLADFERIAKSMAETGGAGAPKDAAAAGLPAGKKSGHEEPRQGKSEKVKVLEDVIPSYTSATLLSSLPPDGEAKKGGVPCEHCLRWKARREDPCCSRCGEALVRLELQGEEVTFEPRGDHTVEVLLDLHNGGQNSLWMTFRVVADMQLARRFKLHAERGVLEGKAARNQLISFDARGLDLTTGYQGALEIITNEQGYTRRFLKLVVERKAAPRVATLGGYVFALGSENVWEFGLANDGGGTIRLTGVRLDASKDNVQGVPLELPGPVVVRGGQTAGVRLGVPELNLPIGAHSRRIIWQFEHHPPVTLDLPFVVKRPPSLAVRPPELDFGVISTSRSKTLNLELFNNGGEELVVESVKPSEKAAAWMECKEGAAFPLRIPPDGVTRVELLVRGGPELAGERRGEVVVRSNSFQNPAQAVGVVVEFVTPTPYGYYVGIDFGTTASSVAVLDKEFKPALLEIDLFDKISSVSSDARLMPSVLFFHDDGSVTAGREALIHAGGEPHKAVTSIKRLLGLKQKKVIAGKEYDAVDVTTRIIEQLLHRAEDGLFQLGEYKTPKDAILTVPIEFLDSQRRALLEACTRAGLNTESAQGIVIDEAQAAALYYLSRKEPGEAAQELERVLIFDWGGGTLDCALTEIESAGSKLVMRTLALGGDPRLGGEDVDWRLVGLLADKAKTSFPEFDLHCLDDSKFEHHYRSLPLLGAAYSTRAQFKRQAEAAKIALGRAPVASVKVTPLLRTEATTIAPYIMRGAEQVALETTLTREELEGVLLPFLERAAGVVRTLCERASTPLSEVHTILHTGRTSLLPMVSQRINAMLPGAKDRSELVGQKVCVAMGAAFWGQIKDLPDADFEFVGVANRSIHDIGYKTVSFTGGLRNVFVPIFGAQTEFPCDKDIEFRRTKESIKLELYENRGKSTAIDGNPEINFIGSVRIDTRGLSEERVLVRFILNENRMLEVVANGHRQFIDFDGE